MYESPIRLLVQQLETNIREQQDKQIFEAIQKFGVDVDRDELIKALAYDRDQYDKGYADGRADAQRWISVEERLPEVDKCYGGYEYSAELLVYDGLRRRTAYYCHTSGVWYDSRYEDDTFEVTHWTPLPEPPKEDA